MLNVTVHRHQRMISYGDICAALNTRATRWQRNGCIVKCMGDGAGSRNGSNSLRTLAEISSSQWGMVTTSQAVSQQISRVKIARLAASGHLERLAHGVYRDAGSPPHEFDDIRAAWLSLDPDRMAEDRIRDGADGIVVSGNTAAALHGIGDLLPTPYVFTSAARRQSQRPEIRFKRRLLAADQITLVAGIPTTGVERTIADLVHDKEYLSLVGDLVGDALRSGTVQLDFLAALLSPLAARNGYPKDDGLALLRKLLELGHVDVASQIKRVASNPAWLSATSPADVTAPSEALPKAIERSQRFTSDDDIRSVQALVKDVNVLQNLATQSQAPNAG